MVLKNNTKIYNEKKYTQLVKKPIKTVISCKTTGYKILQPSYKEKIHAIA